MPIDSSPARVFSDFLNRAGITIAAVALLAMVALVCADVVMSNFRMPIKGTEELVRMFAVIALAFALPATTAAKTHVSIDYFFQKFSLSNRRRLDIVIHTILFLAFAVAAWQCAAVGLGDVRTSGVGSSTLRIPEYWMYLVISLALAVSAFSSLLHLLSPSSFPLKK